jgi:hypothetical protein
MSVNFPELLIVLLLLWYPRHWLRFGAIFGRRKSGPTTASGAKITEPWKTRESGDPKVVFSTEFTKVRNYLDLLRAGVAGLAVIGKGYLEPCLQAAAGASSSQVVALLVLKAVILVIGLLIQTVRYENRHLTFYPPIFYLAGLSVGLCLPIGALFAFVLIWVINVALRGPESFLTVYAAITLLFGKCFDGLPSNSCVMEAVLCFLPVLLSLLLKRPLVIFARKGRRVTTVA